ncbi:neuronal acetylcholine receptor subunit alpha-3-like [Haliotis asinina]|uniref:neuronal acetylcholine receptor subunit alpha-3-like n=1 Tax=Haliotis asinina TaxID=109174 RepID=UPI0035327E0F
MFAIHKCVSIIFICHVTLGTVSYKEKDFLANLTRNYDPKIRPVLDDSNTTISDISGSWIEVTLVLKRRTAFYILNNILPVVFLSFLNIFVFLLPEESGEKVSLCVSILLSYAMFLNVINSYLPAKSDHVCFFSVYVTLLVFISTLICLVTIFMQLFHTNLQSGKVSPSGVLVAWQEDNKVRVLKPRVRNEDVSSNQPEVKDTANKKKSEMNQGIITKCNRVAFGTFFILTVLINLIFFIVVS